MEITVRIFVAIIVGGIIGFERERINRPAGLRTHILVCVGATVISLIQSESIEMTKEMILADPSLANALKADVGRMGAQVVTGVGFLGAGTIIKEKGAVKGLTTAASIWVVACIGLAIGMGMYMITIISVIGVMTAIVFFKKFVENHIDRKYELIIEIAFKEQSNVIKKMNDYFYLNKIDVNSIEYIDKGKEGINVAQLSLDVMKNVDGSKVIQDISAKYNIIKVAIVH